MIENKVCEGTDCMNVALSSCMTSLRVMVAYSRRTWGLCLPIQEELGGCVCLFKKNLGVVFVIVN
jgi:hypothetical protein